MTHDVRACGVIREFLDKDGFGSSVLYLTCICGRTAIEPHLTVWTPRPADAPRRCACGCGAEIPAAPARAHGGNTRRYVADHARLARKGAVPA